MNIKYCLIGQISFSDPYAIEQSFLFLKIIILVLARVFSKAAKVSIFFCESAKRKFVQRSLTENFFRTQTPDELFSEMSSSFLWPDLYKGEP